MGAIFSISTDDRVAHHLRSNDVLSILRELDASDSGEQTEILSAMIHADCPLEILRKVLEHCEKGNYGAASRNLRGINAAGMPEVMVQGMLPVLAAAEDRPEHLRVLLDWGMDCNCGSMEAAEALNDPDTLFLGYRAHSPGTYIPCTNSAISWDACGYSATFDSTNLLESVTPLAAAIFFGNPDCVQVLLERDGLWTTETPSVSQALAMTWEYPDGAFAEVRNLCRNPDGTPWKPALGDAVTLCTCDAMAAMLEAFSWSEEDVRRAALTILADPAEENSLYPRRVLWDWERKLWMLGRVDLRALEHPKVAGHLASKVLCRPEKRSLRVLAHQCCHGRVDLSYDVEFLGMEDTKALEDAMTDMEKHCVLVICRDAVPPHTPSQKLRLLMQHTKLLPSSLFGGVSGMTCAILNTGSIRLTEYALRRGLIPGEETTEAMLEYGKTLPLAIRALLLTTGRPGMGTGPKAWDPEDVYHFDPEVPMDPPEEAASDEAVRQWMLCVNMLPAWRGDGPGYPVRTSLGVLYTDDSIVACAMQGRTEVLLAWLAAQQSSAPKMERDIGLVWSEDAEGPARFKRCILTPLCAAALCGQTETVEALLEAGLDSDERDVGTPSRLFSRGRDTQSLVLTPLTAADLHGHEETALALTARGADREISVRTMARLWKEEVRHE